MFDDIRNIYSTLYAFEIVYVYTRIFIKKTPRFYCTYTHHMNKKIIETKLILSTKK
jgi:hypothetical protein